jgi:hypothetical protein
MKRIKKWQVQGSLAKPSSSSCVSHGHVLSTVCPTWQCSHAAARCCTSCTCRFGKSLKFPWNISSCFQSSSDVRNVPLSYSFRIKDIWFTIIEIVWVTDALCGLDPVWLKVPAERIRILAYEHQCSAENCNNCKMNVVLCLSYYDLVLIISQNCLKLTDVDCITRI